jgi:prepilin-type N-terminal cleavage/methylation domain-containing protein
MNTYSKRRPNAFTLVEIMTVVGLIGLLAALAVPVAVKNRDKGAASACIENLTKIEGAKQQFATETGKALGFPVVVSDLAGPSSYIKRVPVCPAGGTYNYASVGTNATCSVTNSDPLLNHAIQ